MRKSNQQPPEDEGARSFAVVISQLAGGDANRHISAELTKLGKALLEDAEARDRTSKGKLTVELTLSTEPTGLTTITYSTRRKEPTPHTSRGHMWLTDGGNLAVRDPRQPELPGLHVVEGAAERRDIDDAADAGRREV